MQIKVLGPLEATVNGRSVTPTAGKPKQVLALLALHAGHVVPVHTLVEELWDDRPPRSARTTLQTYVLRLRRLIEAALADTGSGCATDLLVTRFDGYLLDICPEAVDIHEFERLARAGERAGEAQDYESAARSLRSALAVWRGPALVDMRRGQSLGIEVVRLEESRLGVIEARVEADMHLGRCHSVLSELAVLTARYPMHENLCAQYMVALFRSGRQAQALEVFRRLRGTLVEELGVEPMPRLKHLQWAILNSDPRLEHVDRTREPLGLLA